MNRLADFLDTVIPLDGASHAQAVEYSVDIPMRYSECYAMLEDGSQVRFKDARRFVGWCGKGDKCNLLFEFEGRRLLLRKEGSTWRAVEETPEKNGYDRGTTAERYHSYVRKFITRDGNLMFVRLANWALEWPRERSQTVQRPVSTRIVDGVSQGAIA